MSHARHRVGVLLAVILTCVLCLEAWGQRITVRAAIEKQDVYVGESVLFQIQIEGADTSITPDLSSIENVKIQELGGQTNNSRSITMINGRTTKTVRRGYIWSYRLTPERPGRLTIPSLQVSVDGRTYKTQPVEIRVNKPEETPDFKLRLALSKDRCYVGEPIVLTVTWFLAKDVRDFVFAVPLLEDDRFFVDDVGERQDPEKSYFRVPVGNAEAIAVKGQARLGGQTYATLTFKKVIIPRVSGAFSFPEATVACEALVGYERSRSRGFFDDFFSDDFFSLGRKGVYRTFVAPSNPLSLEALDLPKDGQPAGFSGLVGEYEVTTSATPAEVNVGDPITLTVQVSGSPYLKHFDLPPLSDAAAFTKRFKIPTDMAPGQLHDGKKVFTQTIRALNDSVKEIPPVSLSYFDVERGEYRVAKSQAIPLEVRATRLVTAEDAEGRELPKARNKLTEWREGIAHNYEDMAILRSQVLGVEALLQSRLVFGILVIPPAVFVVLGIATFFHRKRSANPELRAKKQAYFDFRSAIGDLQRLVRAGEANVPRLLLEALKAYLGKKLVLPGGSLTFRDVAKRTEGLEVSAGTLERLRAVFEECEAAEYAGVRQEEESLNVMVARVSDLVKALDKEL